MAVKKRKKDTELETTQEEQAAATPTKNDVVDIDLSVTNKKRFRIDGDNNRILYLNTSDFGIIGRFQESEVKIAEMLKEYFKDTDDDEALVESIRESDKAMRDLVDYIFASNVADICAPDGSMFDLFNGEFRFEHILNTLLALYSSNMEAEIARMKTNLSRYTRKYTAKRG